MLLFANVHLHFPQLTNAEGNMFPALTSLSLIWLGKKSSKCRQVAKAPPEGIFVSSPHALHNDVQLREMCQVAPYVVHREIFAEIFFAVKISSI